MYHICDYYAFILNISEELKRMYQAIRLTSMKSVYVNIYLEICYTIYKNV